MILNHFNTSLENSFWCFNLIYGSICDQMLIISKEPQTNIPNPTDAIAFKKIMNEKSLILG